MNGYANRPKGPRDRKDWNRGGSPGRHPIPALRAKAQKVGLREGRARRMRRNKDQVEEANLQPLRATNRRCGTCGTARLTNSNSVAPKKIGKF